MKYNKDFLKKYSQGKKLEDGGMAKSDEEVKRMLSGIEDKHGDPRSDVDNGNKIHEKIEKLRKQLYDKNPTPELKDSLEDKIVALRNKLGK